jgi:uncharacterized protein YggT (Ycf19 family)
MSLHFYRVISSICNIALAVITFFLGMRILLQLFNANPATPFVAWIYSVSTVLMSPFRGIFPNLTLGTNAVFDLPAFISLVAYAFVFSTIVALVRAVAKPRDGLIVTEHTHAL